uniref:Uncharacterized protein n=1 Tax=Anguilla anguilla TaxID=7936 RepID=A0A0E9P6Y3_ANGAN
MTPPPVYSELHNVKDMFLIDLALRYFLFLLLLINSHVVKHFI